MVEAGLSERCHDRAPYALAVVRDDGWLIFLK